MIEDLRTRSPNLHVTDTMKDRLVELMPVLRRLCPEGEFIEFLFLSNRGGHQTDLEIDSLWAFSRSFLLECRNFMSTMEIDITACTVRYLGMMASGYVPFGDHRDGPDAAASLEVNLVTDERIESFLSATGANCANLEQVVADRLVPHLRCLASSEPDPAGVSLIATAEEA
jgi:hypothetical protein